MTQLPRLISLDVETAPADMLSVHDDPKGYALEPCRLRSGQAQLLSIAIGQSIWLDDSIGFYKPKQETIAAILQGAVDTGTPVTCWNSTFDVAWLIAMGLRDLVYRVSWLDGMLICRHATNTMNMTGHQHQSFGLKKRVEQEWPGFGSYGEELSEMMGDMRLAPPRKVVHYNRMDALYTWRLTQKFWQMLSPEQRKMAKLEGLAIPMFAETLVEGVDVDTAQAQRLHDQAYEEMKVARVSMSLLTRQTITAEILSSPEQLAILLRETGVPLHRRTDGGKLSVDATALAPLVEQYPICAHALKWRNAHKIRSTYSGPVLEAAAYNPDGRVRPQARMFGTYTGRLTFSSTNSVRGPGKREGKTKMHTVQVGVPIHQWPKKPAIRDVMVAPPGMTIVEADFKGQEYRWMAEYSRDTQMIRCCEPDIDAHSVMAAAIHRMGYDQLRRDLHDPDPEVRAAAEEKRRLGKVGNLACAYRIGVPTLRDRAEADYGVVLAEVEAGNLRQSFKTMYRGVPRYWRRAGIELFKTGHVTTYGGRRIYPPEGELAQLAGRNDLGGEYDTDKDQRNLKKWQAEQTAINGPIQGSGADQKFLALAVGREYILSIGGRLWLDLHDGLLFLVPDAHARAAADMLHELFSNLPYQQVWGKTPCVKFPVDVKMGKVWGQLVTVHE